MKTKPIIFAGSTFHHLFIGLAVIAGVPPTLAQSSLNIAPAGDHAVLSWSTTHTNYVLQSTTNLASPNWATIIGAGPVTVGNNFNFTVSNTSSQSFFRLYLNSGTSTTNTPEGMALIPAGSFRMGDTLDGTPYEVPTNVNVSAFFMDTNLVTLSRWQGVYSYATNHGYNFDSIGSGKAANHPVQTVSWYDVVKWTNARSQQAGLTPVYYINAALTVVYTNGDVDAVYPNWSVNGYRLPTEAEWEKAARGGSSGLRFPWGKTISESHANYKGLTGSYSYDLGPDGFNAIGLIGGEPYTSPVGTFAPNGYGLFDMAGNVWEWCWDWYGTPYGQPTPTNPTGPSTGSHRVFRGGSWYQGPENATCAQRGTFNGGGAVTGPDNLLGFRCVRGL